jgi:BASS family bile acid:Na+ symporter
MDLDSVRLNFNKDSVIIINALVGIIMFGVALDLRKNDFLHLLRNPKPAFVGIVSQYILLPLVTLALIYIIQPHPGLALGMILVASCPGGNMSNLFTSMAKGNLALSVSLTTFSSSLSFLITPLAFLIWGNVLPSSRIYLKEIAVDPIEMLLGITIMLLIPLLLGIVFQKAFPKLTSKIKSTVQRISVLLLGFFVIGALLTNFKFFIQYIDKLFYLVFLMNLFGLLVGYYFAKISNLGYAERKTIAIETGIQNSSLGLAIVFNFFDGLGGMALICAWWGIWHLISGAALSYYWGRKQESI